MRRVGIIDYGLCNVDSVRRAVEVCGGEAVISAEAEILNKQDLLILPGVGAFAAAMTNLKERGLIEFICQRVAFGTPLLGICLGMQLLAEYSDEGGRSSGLGLIPGEVILLKGSSVSERVPHMGWNSVEFARDDTLFDDIVTGADFYFVHSYHFKGDDADVLARTPFCGEFASVVRRGQVWGTQFHPEKSWPTGHRLLANFMKA